MSSSFDKVCRAVLSSLSADRDDLSPGEDWPYGVAALLKLSPETDESASDVVVSGMVR